MATISIDGTICKGNDKYEAIATRTFNGKDGQQTMATFRVAVYQSKDKEGKSVYGYWKCVAFGQLAENIYNGLKAGDTVTITGAPRIEEWVKQSGEKTITPAVVVDTIGRAISKFAPRQQGNPYEAAARQAQAVANSLRTDTPFDFGEQPDIPF